MIGDRDQGLGSSLRELYVPEHAPDFFPRLVERLEAEAADNRRGRPPRRLRPQPFTFLGAVAAAIVVVLAVTWVGLPGTDGSGLGPRRASAAEVQARVSKALSTLKSLRGEASVEYPFVSVTVRSSFVLTSAGDFRVIGRSRREDVAYSSRTGVLRQYQVLPGGSVVATETRGLAPGPPDPSASPAPLLRSLASVAQAFVEADTDQPVRAIDYEGRPAWRVVVPVSVNLAVRPGAGSELVQVGELDVTVDRRTGFPLRTIASNGGTITSIVRLSRIELNRGVSSEDFSLAFPTGTLPVAPVDLGFRRVPLRAVEGRVGYAPLVPRRLPAGFRLAEVAVAEEAPATQSGNPDSSKVVSLAYRRGFDTVIVTTRAVGDDPSAWADPLSPLNSGGAIGAPPPERVELRAGAIRGARAELVVRTQEVPHVWAISDDLVVTVAGDLSRAELIEATNSLDHYERKPS